MATAVTESALLAALSALLYMASWMPLLSQFVLLACGMPITIAGVKHGGQRAWLAALCSTIVVTLTGGPTEGFFFISSFGILGAICGHFMHVDEEPGRGFLLGAGWFFVLLVPATCVIERVLGLGDSLGEVQRGFVWCALVVVDYLPGLDPQAAKGLGDLFSRVTATGVLCPLAFFAAFSAVMYYSNHLFSFLVCWRLRLPVPPPPDLRALRTPRSMLLVMPVLAFACLATGPTSGTVPASLALNAFAIALFIAYVGGFAVTVILLDRSTLPPLKRMGVSLLVMFPLFWAAILIGLADAALDLRGAGERPMKKLRRF